MLKKVLKYKKKQIIIYSLIIFIICSVFYSSIAFVVHKSYDQGQMQKILYNQQQMIYSEEKIITNELNRLISDLLYILDDVKIDYKYESKSEELNEQLISFSNRKKIYDQIRFIDKDGYEKIRVDYDNNKAHQIEEDELQDKSDRYYVKDTLNLKEDYVYLSKFDLNMENGEIEIPINPAIRLSTPYYGEDDTLYGMVVLNYSAENLLENIKGIAGSSDSNIYMVNADSHWIFNEKSRDKEWCFMYEHEKNQAFSEEFKEEWELIKENKNSFITSNGVFYVSSILDNDLLLLDNDYNIEFDDRQWYIISHIEKDSKEGELFYETGVDTIFEIIEEDIKIYVLFVLISILFAIILLVNREENEKIKYFSEYDDMTGVYNRRRGIEKLDKLYEINTRNRKRISICFIDINGLKLVNDTLGHEVGDELILSVSKILKQNIFEDDFVIRLGGDEFLIVFDDIDESESEKVFDNIVKDYDYINNNENRKYLISVSHGIGVLDINSSENIDEIIAYADEKMYKEKRNIKKDIKIIR